MPGQIVDRFVAVANYGLLYRLSNISSAHPRPDQFQGGIQTRLGGQGQILVAAKVYGDGSIGDVAVHMHSHIQLHHILGKYALVLWRGCIMSRAPVQRYVAGKCRQAAL